MKFYKAHGLGNDFIITFGENPYRQEELAKLCDRHFGIGSDGIVFLTKQADGYHMKIYNQDGSLAKTCGNALRCVGKLLLFQEGVDEMILHTDSASHRVNLVDGRVITYFDLPEYENPNKISLNNQEFYLVNVGNLHAMTKVDDVMSFDFVPYAKVLQKAGNYNLEAHQIANPSNVFARFFEYGCGETTSCSSGTVALFYHLLKQKAIASPCKFIALGGELVLSLKDDKVQVEGDANIVYKGEWFDEEIFPSKKA